MDLSTFFENCKAAGFNHAGSRFGAIALEPAHKEVLLYNVGTSKLEQRLISSLPRFPVDSIVSEMRYVGCF